ncbi:MAG: site-specific recombinase [Parcubacteria bacterium RAAC4_OD1_1]|nr:MAG: site-specific recombinase [Parcubacteria bacterium RAAC4_OD1_1]
MIGKKIEKPNNAVIYLRVSSREQITNFSLESQEKVCREYCRRNGYEVLQVFREEGESAKTVNRTELQKMIRFCEINKRQISKIVFYNVSRMSRVAADYLILKRNFKKHDISVVSATEGFDESPSGKLQETMLSAFAEFDNNQRSDKTKEGMQTRLLKGLWSGIAPWGYFNGRDKDDTKIIIPHPDKAPIVKILFEKYATGKYSFKELARMANKQNVKTMHGSKMCKQLVAKIVKNHIYYGRMIVSKLDIDIMGKHEPIITKELFDRANSNRSSSRKGLPRSRENKDYPLRGIKCGCCGKSISGGKSRSKTGKYYQYYSCVNSECEKRKAIRKEALENDFTSLLSELTPNNDYLDVLGEAIKLAHKNELNYVINEERKFKGILTELSDKKNKLLDLRIDGKINDEDFILTRDRINSKISEAEKELSMLSSPEIEINNVIDAGIKFIKDLPRNWKDLEVKDIRILIGVLFKNLLIYSYPDIKTPEVCCIYNIKPELLSDKTHWVTLPGIEPGLPA